MQGQFSLPPQRAQPSPLLVFKYEPAQSIKDVEKYPWKSGVFREAGDSHRSQYLSPESQITARSILSSFNDYLIEQLAGEQVGIDFMQTLTTKTGTARSTIARLAFSLLYLDAVPLLSTVSLPPSPFNVVPRTRVLGKEAMNIPQFKVLENWPTLFEEAAAALSVHDSRPSGSSPPQPNKPSGYNQPSMSTCFQHLRNIKSRDSKVQLDTIALNLEVCAFNLHWLSMGYADLPRTVTMFKQLVRDGLQNPHMSLEDGLFDMPNLRTPLQSALAISPLSLLSSGLKLLSMKAQSAQLLQLWYHMGNQRPERIRRLESIVWRELGLIDGVSYSAVDALRSILAEACPILEDLDYASRTFFSQATGESFYAENTPIWPLVRSFSTGSSTAVPTKSAPVTPSLATSDIPTSITPKSASPHILYIPSDIFESLGGPSTTLPQLDTTYLNNNELRHSYPPRPLLLEGSSTDPAPNDDSISLPQSDVCASTETLVEQVQSPVIALSVPAQDDAAVGSAPVEESLPVSHTLNTSEQIHLPDSEVLSAGRSALQTPETLDDVEDVDHLPSMNQSGSTGSDETELFARIMGFSSAVDKAEAILQDCLKTLPDFVRVNRFDVLKSDLVRTGVDRWFNDSIINAFLSTFAFRPDCWVMESLTWATFADKLASRRGGRPLPKLFRAWQERFLCANVILIPAHDSGGKHWNAIAIDRPSRTVTLYDSLWRSGPKCKNLLRTVTKWLDAMCETANQPTVKWNTVISTCSQTLQTNSFDCGPFVIGNIVLHAHSGGELNHLLIPERISIVRATVLQKILGQDVNTPAATESHNVNPSTSNSLTESNIVNRSTVTGASEEMSPTLANPSPFIQNPSTASVDKDDSGLDNRLEPNNGSDDVEMLCSTPTLRSADPMRPSTPYDAPLPSDTGPSTFENQQANWSPSFPMISLDSSKGADVQGTPSLLSGSLRDTHGETSDIPSIPQDFNLNALATEEALGHDSMDVDVPTLSPIQRAIHVDDEDSDMTDLPTEEEEGVIDNGALQVLIIVQKLLFTFRSGSPPSTSPDAANMTSSTTPNPGEPILRRSTRERKPVEPYIAHSINDSVASKPKPKAKKTVAVSASEQRTRRTSSPERKESKYHLDYLATLKRAEFQPTLRRPRMGGKVYYITSYGGQSYFYKAFMLKTKDQDLLDALFEASGSLRSVPDRFAKYPANDSVLSKPLMPDPLEAGPPNQFRRKCISTFTFNDYQEESVVDLQRIFRTRPIVISGVPKIRAHSKWDETSMSRLGCLKTLRQAHDASITIEKDPNEAIIKASLSDALKEGVNVNSSKPLNFVDIPGHGETLFPGDMSTDAIAIKHTLFDLSLYNSSSSNFSWHIVSTKDAFSPIHMDAQGTATMLTVEVGTKLVFMLVPKCSDYSAVSNISYSLDIALSTDDDPIHRLARRINCDVQGVLLLPGDVLLMPPATYHIVFTLEPTICNGRHFFSSSTIRQTCWGLFHTLILGDAITNEDHTITRGVLVRLLGFWHQLFVGKDWSSADNSIGHTPDWLSMAGVADFLTVACVIELGPALWSESYCDGEIPEKDIQELAVARDWSRAIFESYIAAHSFTLNNTAQGLTMRSTDFKSTSMWSDLRCSFFTHIMCCVVEHANRAESDMDIPRAMKDHLHLQGDL
ncbi:hypothetical protein PQX77_021420, partial [Marasmius sp. AFHP31]